MGSCPRKKSLAKGYPPTMEAVPGPVLAVVDDDPEACASLSAMLGVHGLSVVDYASARDFLQARRAFACLIVDVHMPGMSGLALLAHLRAERNDCPAILLTGLNDPDIVDQAAALGAIAVFDKPVDVQDLLATIRRVVSVAT